MIPCVCTSFRSLFLALITGICLYFGFDFAPRAVAQEALTASPTRAHSQKHGQKEKRFVPAILISDIHFDPFHDPDKTGQLVDAPVSQWQSILSAPATPNQEAAFAELQHICHARGVDTPYPLLHSSLQAMQSRESDAAFMTVSGDLIAHAFSCRYKTLFPSATPADLNLFVVKTLSFVMGELRATFPGMPVYAALGNNDSNCGDYQLDSGSDFLAQAGKSIVGGLPQSQQENALKQFGAGGYYSVTMAGPMRATRLIVVNDLFFSPRYSTCGGKPDPAAAAQQISWLGVQLAQARQAGQRVWVLGHIPPGVDPFTTVGKFRNVCGGQAPTMFLASNSMADALTGNADVVRLGLFGHTHMDEVRLLVPPGNGGDYDGKKRVAIKMVPSISPVDGNNPSFTIARVDSFTSVLLNYDVFAASNQTGIDTTWNLEYDFSKTYHAAQFSPATVNRMVDKFKRDHSAKAPESAAFLRNYLVGDKSPFLRPFWPEYSCALDTQTAEGFSKCVCAKPNVK